MESGGLGEVAEFIYQALVTGADKHILDLMDLSDAGFYEALEQSGLTAMHSALKNFIVQATT